MDKTPSTFLRLVQNQVAHSCHRFCQFGRWKKTCSCVGADTELFRVDLLVMERSDVPREGAEARRESSSHDCAVTVFWGCGCVTMSPLDDEREALIVLRARLKGRLSPWAASASLLGRVLASDQEDKPRRGACSSEKGKIWAWGPVFCCLLSALFTPVGCTGLLKQPHGRQHCGNTGKLLSSWLWTDGDAAVEVRGLKVSFCQDYLWTPAPAPGGWGQPWGSACSSAAAAALLMRMMKMRSNLYYRKKPSETADPLIDARLIPCWRQWVASAKVRISVCSRGAFVAFLCWPTTQWRSAGVL